MCPTVRLVVSLTLVLLAPIWVAPTAAEHRGLRRITVNSLGDLRDWDRAIDQMLGNGELGRRQVRDDTLRPGRVHERSAQYYRGVPVFGGDVSRQLEGGQTISIFGALYEGIDLDPSPGLSVDEAAAIIERLSGTDPGPSRLPELAVFPTADGGYRLTYRAKVLTASDLRLYFVDARTGILVFDFSLARTIVGIGRGVLSDQKKISVDGTGAEFIARDLLRPPSILTFDMKGNLNRTLQVLNGRVSLLPSDLASDADNDWGDGAIVDAHVHGGWTHDYLFKRFGRRGLDDANVRIVSIVHPVRREDALLQPGSIIGLFYLNAFYAGDGVMVYGEGLPPNLTVGGKRWNFFSGSLDIVAHELAHGVTEYSSDLIYMNESGALNEAFSDIMATGVEFFFQTPGAALLRADYVMGEDVITPGGIRSLADPGAYGDPDHYSKRYKGPSDNGGVHTNSAIPSHAFYLAIEGGTNRTSGLVVNGVGSANREQIEKIFYRAFAQLLPSNATFATAREACIQAARDLYGAGSPAERAVTDAWTAVGMN